MKAIRLLYDGPAVAGRTTSLASALAQLTGRRHTWAEARSPTGIDFALDTGQRVTALVSAARGKFGRAEFERPTSARDRNVREMLDRELDFLAHVDGVIFVIDSRLVRSEASLESFEVLQYELAHRKRDPSSVPMVFQANQRDLPDIVSMEWVRDCFRSERAVYTESIATRDIGTVEAMYAILRLLEAMP
jgi:hypothetical protein